MRKVLTSTNSQPNYDGCRGTARPALLCTCHTTGAVIGTQNQNISASTMDVTITYVLRSAAGYDTGPPALEAATGHHAVLNAEQDQQQQVNTQGFSQGAAAPHRPIWAPAGCR